MSGDDPSEPESQAAPQTDAEEAEPDEAAGDADHVILELPTPAPVLRKPGPWSWPLAEPDEERPRPAGAARLRRSTNRVLRSWSRPWSRRRDTRRPRAAFESGVDSGFFHRDEPVGSQYVDFDEVRNELVQIGSRVAR